MVGGVFTNQYAKAAAAHTPCDVYEQGLPIITGKQVKCLKLGIL